ncbi:MAG: hypothetical protein WC761_01860 [Candidatus Paceibacterota bacterium]|jgi:hypothetical protein
MPNFLSPLGNLFDRTKRKSDLPSKIEKPPEGWAQNKNGPTLFFKTYQLQPNLRSLQLEGSDRISVLILDILSLQHPPEITIEIEQNLKASEITFKVLGNCDSLNEAFLITISIEKLCNDSL